MTITQKEGHGFSNDGSLASARWIPPTETSLIVLEGADSSLHQARRFLWLWLEQIQPTIDYLRSTTEKVSNAPVIALAAMWTSALIWYARAFAVQPAREALLSSMDEEDRKTHEHLINVRNLYFAHPLNRFEMHEVTVWFETEGPHAGEVGKVSASTMSMQSPSKDEIRKAMDLVTKLRAHLASLMTTECDRLLGLANQLTPSEVLALPRETESLHPNPRKRR
jgi:hypothetical protein